MVIHQSRIGALSIHSLVLSLSCMAIIFLHCCGFLQLSPPFTAIHRCPASSYRRLFHATSACRLNRFLFDPEEVQTTPSISNSSSIIVPTVILPKDDYRTVHAANILCLRNGDSVRAGIVSSAEHFGQWTDEATIEWIPEHPVKKAEVLNNGNPPGSLSIQLNNLIFVDADDDKKKQSASSEEIPVSLILALPRPLQLGRIIPMVSQMGVDHLVLTSARKVPKDYFGSHLFVKPQIMRAKLIEGLCQAGDVRLPKLHVKQNLRHFLSDELETLFPRESYARVIAHPKRKADIEDTRIREIEFPTVKPPRIVLAVGPEGGWEEPDELELFQRLGFQQVTLGSRTLRTDCAVVGLLSLAHEVCYEKNHKEDCSIKGC